ncbi:SURP and G-patch domain-containing protein 1-like protein [Linum grandiflorum]
MDKKAPSSLFVNDGSFMERFRQLQQDNGKDQEKDKGTVEKESRPKPIIMGSVTPKPSVGKISMQLKGSGGRNTPQSASGGKLAFSLKQKSKIVAPAVRLGADEDDEDEVDAGNLSSDLPAKRQKLGRVDASEQSSRQEDVGNDCLYICYSEGVNWWPFRSLGALDILVDRNSQYLVLLTPTSPSDPTVKKVADKLASFVAKNGRQFESVTRQKNPGDTPFKFLFDKASPDYKYYEFRLAEEEKILGQTKDSDKHAGATSTSTSKLVSSQRSHQQQPNYQIPASALYGSTEDPRISEQTGEYNAPTDPIAMMEFYMKKAAHEEKRKQPRQSKDEMPPPASLQSPGPPKRGHHMGDYIPPEELAKFMASCNDAAAQKAAQEAAERARIQADNVGHKLLSKMGWREGEGLGSSRSGIADPIMAGNIKKDNLGVGAQQPGEVAPEDDIYEQYKKRMMLGYRHRPNPLGNPRKAYY